MNSLRKIQVLTDFGLTVTQAKAYLCLISLKQSNASHLAKYSEVPRQDIYRILSELFDLGLVEKVVKVPNEFRAISANKCVALLVKRQKRRINELKNQAIENLCINDLVTLEEQISYSTIIVQKREATLMHIEELLSSVEKTIFFLSPPQKLYPLFFEQSRFFERAIKRNVKVKLLTLKNNQKKPKIFEEKFDFPYFEIRFSDELPNVSFSLYDKSRIIIELDVNSGYLNSQILVSNNPALAQLGLETFKFNWSKSRQSDFRVINQRV